MTDKPTTMESDIKAERSQPPGEDAGPVVFKNIGRSAELDVTVQICSYNRCELLARSLGALFEQNYPPDRFEIIVVDDGSTDGTSDMVRGLKPPCDLTLISQGREGLAVGRNRGARMARGRYVLFVDDDIIADPGLIRAHLEYHQEHPNCVVKGWVNHVDNLDHPGPPRFNMADFSTAFFWTSNVSVAREDLLTVGLFDEHFREYGWEDLELGLRLQRKGLCSRFNRKALAYHYKGRWRKADVKGKILQAHSKGRTAVIFMRLMPSWRVRLTTGIHFLNLGLHSLLATGGKRRKWCEETVAAAPDGILKGLPLYCARQLVTDHYYQTIKDVLAGRSSTEPVR